jgi:hypothetical protein
MRTLLLAYWSGGIVGGWGERPGLPISQKIWNGPGWCNTHYATMLTPVATKRDECR